LCIGIHGRIVRENWLNSSACFGWVCRWGEREEQWNGAMRERKQEEFSRE
jgi:hypothetical protein